jgi:cytochrome c oxidase subunit 3
MNSVTVHGQEHHRDATGARIGMWLFLFTELILFGGLFLLYAVYRSSYPEDFHYAASQLDTSIGTLNTLILLTSSLTMALSIGYLERGRRRLSSILIAVTIFLGLFFLVNKVFEWSAKFSHHLYPNSEELLLHTPGENVFYALYYSMTGLHGLHVLAGIGVLTFMLYFVARKPRRSLTITDGSPSAVQVLDADGKKLWQHETGEGITGLDLTFTYEENEELTEGNVIKLENSGLYWHLVDVIWIFLFPLFYLIT